MVKSITVVFNKNRVKLNYTTTTNKIELDKLASIIQDCSSFLIEIEFDNKIEMFRNNNFQWQLFTNHISNEYSPKIIKLKNGQYIQANKSIGIWQLDKNNKTTLLWKFNPIYANPITNYENTSNSKIISQANTQVFNHQIALLLVKNPIEFSRSKIPFSAIACFTDHCDFDTSENLKIQRLFFKENNIKLTKGFFLNQFSKRDDNASFENDKKEIEKWKEDGHELCYHSLSQSLKPIEESISDFKNFKPPFHTIPVWIDHGFQPYNFSTYKNNLMSDEVFENILIDKNITTLWNYIDSGTATTGVINQVNTNHFTLNYFLEGNKDLGFLKKMQLLIKNIIFHFYSNEKLIYRYKIAASNFKKIVYERNIKIIFPFLYDFLILFSSIMKVFLFWNKNKNKPYKLAEFIPILFKHRIFSKDFFVFQTIELLDFKKSLCKKNIDSLIEEKGVFIAHTYFSNPLKYHSGRLFSSENIINKEITENFNYLGNKITNLEIWNPTLTELIDYWSNFEKIVLNIDHNGKLTIENNEEIIYREII